MSSEQLADYFGKLTVSGTSKICVLIGGSCGLSERDEKEGGAAAVHVTDDVSASFSKSDGARADLPRAQYRRQAASTTSEEACRMIDGELVTIIVNLLLVGGFLWWMRIRGITITKSRRCRNRCRKPAKCAVPMCGAEAKVTGKQWECPWCGDCGWIK